MRIRSSLPRIRIRSRRHVVIGSAVVGVVLRSAVVSFVLGSAIVGFVLGSAVVGLIFGFAVVGVLGSDFMDLNESSLILIDRHCFK